jgi:hypothetical protein
LKKNHEFQFLNKIILKDEIEKKTKKNELLEGEIEENNYSIKKEPKKINQVNLDQSIKLET